MKEYIEKDRLVGVFLDKKFSTTESSIEYGEAINFIQKQPTADVQEVVRCKDCKSYNKHYGECTLFGAHLGENGFCSEGAKMDKSDMEHIL